MAKVKPNTVEEYIAQAPPEAQEKIAELRAILQSLAPQAKEELKWNTPVYTHKRILFSYSAFRSHLNFMPTRRTLDHFREDISAYKTGMDTIQLPYDQPLPRDLIIRLAQHRIRDVEENDSLWMGK